ncbi:hypothetical protein AYM40_23295 [Paraburkholderia phytofirmans OLGA172]|uniref:Uncharacterized protein n=1 Tax=Paraburkholderia phytofirmans OLGA172 TaxID=1417228 RepID=A0A160FRQ0_9BURK|nr:hypothetical protein [Paraburkholderia phytofirmans]ANB75316.1 hypothetical protein AYM40_23295 [Paraburkholderia phytofirmans OLGA172]
MNEIHVDTFRLMLGIALIVLREHNQIDWVRAGLNAASIFNRRAATQRNGPWQAARLDSVETA